MPHSSSYGSKSKSATVSPVGLVRLSTVTWYELIKEVGRGHMGIVYKARHAGLGKIVAVKVLRDAHFASRRERDRFRSEAAEVARLDHPHVVRVFDYGEHEDTPFFCMEYLKGGTLAQRFRKGPLTPANAAEMMETLARAVHHAHGKKIIHRDLKPGNILFAADGTPKIVDFGIAKYGKGHGTQDGAILGTECYMAPEQACGNSRAVTVEADVYSLGTILYHALAGEPPFRGLSMMETLRRVCEEEPLPPSHHRDGVPPALEAICLRCLRKEPGSRYRSASALAEALRRARTVAA
jgi:eukaryotic-like serine/threonine-protein kinase